MNPAHRSPPIPVATWIRAGDVVRFQTSLAEWPQLALCDARTASGTLPLESCRALLLTGGADVSAAFLKQPVAAPSLIESPEPDRDAWEFAAVVHAFERGWPILAVCRGMQVLNVALGGTLHLHIDGHREASHYEQDTQPLRLAAGTAVGFAAVNSSHHQALAGVADGLVVEAWSASDGVIEQVRHRDPPWCVGVQYHPERSAQYRPLFAAFAAAVLATRD